MKKKLALLLVILLLSSLLAGCGSTSQDTPSQPTSSVSGSATPDSSQPSQQPSQSSSQQDPQPTASTPGAPVSAPTFDAYPRPNIKSDGKIKVAQLYRKLDQDDKMRYFRQLDIECYNRDWELINIDANGGEENIRTAWLTAINMEVDAIVIPGQDNLINKFDLIEQSRNAGIAVYTTDCTAVTGVITNFNTAMGVGALQLFYQVASDLDYKGDFCISTAYTYTSVWERSLPVYSYLVNESIFPDLNLLDEQAVDFSSPIALPEQCYQFMQTWNQKYGMDIDAVFVASDNDALVMNESAIAAGRTPDDLIFFTIGGAARVIRAMRDPNCMIAYDFTLSPEYVAHLWCELIDQIQVQGLTPGDGQCMINAVGGNTNISGQIVTKNNLPKEGDSIHVIQPYYDPNDKDAWYFWTSPNYEVYTWED